MECKHRFLDVIDFHRHIYKCRECGKEFTEDEVVELANQAVADAIYERYRKEVQKIIEEM